MPDEKIYDACIVGGGLAGLSLSIQLAKVGYSVILFEKEKYPFHKVCGEYISLESWDFILKLGLNLHQLDLPIIKKLKVSSPSGNIIDEQLPLGGFGISRFLLDHKFSEIAKKSGVELYDSFKVSDIIFKDDVFAVTTLNRSIKAKVVAGTYGKRSNIDIKWSRDFIIKRSNRLNNYIGIKYHVKTQLPADTIALHNFKNGYCGVSKIEDDKYCLCYLTTADNLRINNNSIAELEKNVLQRNPLLKKLFSEIAIIPGFPITIAQISFDKKTQVEDHVIMIGDAAGMITPLCGNGMSMALHGSKIAFECIHQFLQNKITRYEMERIYTSKWKKNFAFRLSMGRLIQRFFGKDILTNLFLSAIKLLPVVTRKLIRSTHGKPF